MKPRHLVHLRTYGVLWRRLRWAFGGERECGVCEHDPACYLSPHARDGRSALWVIWRRIGWAFSGDPDCGVCEHDRPCYLSPYVWDEEAFDHVLPEEVGLWRP